ncbi:sensor domain-containing diguanylate cyclase [Rhodococcus sp. G-MC3]|uniref:sensor domain-containing diguanylate cyclase n=1 Tax=Rhodococcus sp. G-MC3 TaxID=3046209 RepID=UPI0024BAFD0A|nr:sensor domain-containing diguanylate cyclase [Rhodococcus sp. G-MC3]MDJ0392249.1 sensor domain-containing diguanylate cyclase [Rhodococcus sp. G-MC3]
MTTISAAEGAILANFVDAVPAAVLVHTMDFQVVAANRLCEDVLGYTTEEMLSRLVADFIPTEDRDSARELAGLLGDAYPAESPASGRPIIARRRVVRRDGSVISCWMQIGIAHLAGLRVIVACIDLVNPVDGDSRWWRERAERDDLTGLLRRAAFLDRVDAWVQRDLPMTLAFVDVDRLKAINDTYGHRAGDLVLEAAARRLRSWAPSWAVVGRFSGDEFVVACSGDKMSAERLTASLRSAVCSEPVPWATEQLVVSVSIGAVERRDGEDSRDLVNRADALMYRDKAGSRGTGSGAG